MKCPVCGQEIKAGNLYCEVCGEEIRIVPDFEPEIENSINETLYNVAGEIEENQAQQEETHILRENQKEAEKALQQKKQSVARITMLLTAFCMAILFLMIMYVNDSASYQIKKAQKYMEDNRYQEALPLLQKASKGRKNDSSITLKIAECYENLGESESATDLLLTAADKKQMSEEEKEQVYEKLISIYEKNGEYDQINEVLQDCSDETIQTKFQHYMALPPTYSYEGGVYENVLFLRLSANTTGTIYYTLDGTVPDETAIRYVSPIQLEAGRYQINAIFINDYGITSDVVRNLYVIDLATPTAPEVVPESGTYHEPTMIEIEVMEDCQVYYTMDKTIPDENAKEYTEPIEIPLGRSNFKFIAISKEGVKSEITSRSYYFTFDTSISIEMAASRIISALVDRKVLLNSKGDIPGGGRSRFQYNHVVQIGESYYYIFNEYTTSASGAEKQEERMYAVEVYTGTPNRLTMNDGVMGLIPLS